MLLYVVYFDCQCNPIVEKKKDGLACTSALIAIGQYDYSTYKPFVHSIMSKKGRLNPESILNAAKTSGISEDEADGHIKSKKNRHLLLKEVDDAVKIGIKATPTFVLNGRVLPSGAIHPHMLETLIKKEIKKVYGK